MSHTYKIPVTSLKADACVVLSAVLKHWHIVALHGTLITVGSSSLWW